MEDEKDLPPPKIQRQVHLIVTKNPRVLGLQTGKPPNRNGSSQLICIPLSSLACTLHTISSTSSLKVRRCEQVVLSLQHYCSWPKQEQDPELFVEEDSHRQATSELVNILRPINGQ